jgi:preprotein translocase subunit SecD
MARRLVGGTLLSCIVLFGGNVKSIAAEDEKPTVVLKYEIDPESNFYEEVGEDGTVNRELDIDALSKALQKRLRRAGKVTALENRQIQVELYGDLDQAELDSIKRRISDGGVLEFRILASKDYAIDRAIIEQATRLPPSEKVIEINGKPVAKWVRYAEAEFGPVNEEDEAVIKRLANGVPEALVLIDAVNLKGAYINAAYKGLDERGAPSVHLSFDREGARRMRKLTTENKPNPMMPNVFRHLGIILDKKLLSAPRIVTAISDRATISGGSMTERDVEHIVDFLNAGSVPLVLRLVSEEQVAR